MDAAAKWILLKHDDGVKEEKSKSKSSTNKRKMNDVDAVANIKKKRKMNNMSKQQQQEMSKLYGKSSKRKRNHTVPYVVNRNKRRNKMLNYTTRHQTRSSSNNDVYKAIRYLRKRKMNYNDKDEILSKDKRNNLGKAKTTEEDEILPQSVKKSSSGFYLSENLIFTILSISSVTSLLRCKSVCKLWHSIISEHEFLIAHHLNSLTKLPSILMITSGANDNKCCHAATILYPNSLKQHSVNIPLMPPFDNLEFVSSFNGVVCVFNNQTELYLLNPLTRMYKKLTLPPAVATATWKMKPWNTMPTFPRPPVIKYLRPAFKFGVGFGFDCISHDFKVLFLEYWKSDTKKHVELGAANLYSSNSDSWRVIKVGTGLPSLLYYPQCPVLRSGPVVDGVLYMEGVDAIITFDLHTELFGLISYPSFVHTRKSNVLDFEGSVAVVLETVPDGSLVEKELSLWTPVAAFDVVVWNKMFTFGSGSEEIVWLFLYSGANQFFGKTRLGEMLYDYRKKQIKYVELPSQSFLLRVLNHTESFLSAEGLEGFKDS